MVARALVGCGVTLSGIITSHITRTPFLREGSGYSATGLSAQSEDVPFGLLRRGAVEAPEGQLFERGKIVEFFDERFAAQVGTGL